MLTLTNKDGNLSGIISLNFDAEQWGFVEVGLTHVIAMMDARSSH
jgi:hypothetical protein